MVTRRLLPLTLALVPLASGAASFGAIMVSADGTLRLHIRDSLSPTDSVAVQYIAANGEIRCCHRFSAANFEPMEASDAYQEVVSGNPTRNYRMTRGEVSPISRPYAGMAVIFGRSFKLRRATTNRISASADGEKISGSLCTSTEGFHVLQGREGAPDQDIHVSLQYTIESPTCKAR